MVVIFGSTFPLALIPPVFLLWRKEKVFKFIVCILDIKNTKTVLITLTGSARVRHRRHPSTNTNFSMVVLFTPVKITTIAA